MESWDLGNSCRLYLLSSSATNTGSLISIEPGTVQYADVSPPSNISWYAPEFCRFAYQGFLLLNELELLFHAF